MADQNDPKATQNKASGSQTSPNPDESLGNQTRYGSYEDSRQDSGNTIDAGSSESQDDSTAHSSTTMAGHDASAPRSPFKGQDAKADSAEKGDTDMSITNPMKPRDPGKSSQ